MTKQEFIDKFTEGYLPFYGAVNHVFRTGDVFYQVIEDPNDGYRSSCENLDVIADPGGLFDTPIDWVRTVGIDPKKEVMFLVAADGHIWLEFGTEDYAEYYPGFVFRYHPREPKVV